MTTKITSQERSRHILIHGLMLVMVGLLWGLLVPLVPHTPHPRLALGAHIQFVTNGLLIVVMAVALLTLPHNIGPKSTGVMLLAAWLTWPMALSRAANAWGAPPRCSPSQPVRREARAGLHGKSSS